MKKTTIALITLGLILMPLAASADDAATTFAARCKACHGADGKKLAKADLTSAALKAKADSELVTFLTTDAKHKTKVTDAATAKALVAYIKALK